MLFYETTYNSGSKVYKKTVDCMMLGIKEKCFGIKHILIWYERLTNPNKQLLEPFSLGSIKICA